MTDEKIKQFNDIQSETIKDCPILFHMYDRPMSETTMCWGFECGYGWYNAISDACRELEVLNTLFYSKTRVRIQADQIKSKFGYLCFYYSVTIDPGKFATFMQNFCYKCFYKIIRNVNFETKRVEVIAPHEYDDVKEITKEEFEKENTSEFKYANVKFEQKNDKYYKITSVKNYGKYEYVPTKHKFIYHMANVFKTIGNLFNCFTLKVFKDNSATRNAYVYMHARANEIIERLMKTCSNTCEKCGMYIGSDWSPKCQTTGWISYICEKCAVESGNNYVMNGKLYNNKIEIKNERNKKSSKSKKQNQGIAK